MSRARPVPKNKAVNFEPHELFFSRTDPRGIILSGNKVFVRISGYSIEELLSKPHNIIRHPDMPRAVFQLFWDFLKAQRPVCAYVKNMAKDGSYYWVYAAAFPIEGGGYLSLRLKPTTPIQPIVEAFYADLLKLEAEHGMAAAYEAVSPFLNKLGFENYEHFMTHALFTEINSRRGLMKAFNAPKTSPTDSSLSPQLAANKQSTTNLLYESEVLERYSSELFDNLIVVVNSSTAMQDCANKIFELFTDLKRFSLNMIIAAEKAGDTSRALVAVAEAFEALAFEIKAGVENISKSLDPLKYAIRDAEFKCAASQLQAEMIRIFSGELIDHQSAENRLDFITNFEHLFSLIHGYSREVEGSLTKLIDTLTSFTNHSASLDNIMVGLEMIRLRGAMEASSLPLSASFVSHIRSMQEFTRKMREQLDVLIEKNSTSLSSAQREQDTLTRIYKQLTHLKQRLSAL